MNNKDTIWIDWGQHLRTHSLTSRLRIPLVEVVVSGGRLKRYLTSILRTARAIHRARPKTVFATNPSIVLGYLLLVLRLRYRFSLVLDAHYVGVTTLLKWPGLQAALDLLNRGADLVIVTNAGHERALLERGARPFICPDPLPRVLKSGLEPLSLPDRSVFLICSFDLDEPFETVFTAFEVLAQEGFRLYVSGNYRKAGIDPAAHPRVQFLGFVSEADYYAYLGASDVVMDLTTLEHCLVCGAYEAMAMGKPLVLSRTRALRDYFTAGCVFTANTAEAISEAVRTAHREREQLEAASRDWVEANEHRMDEILRDLQRRVATDTGTPGNPPEGTSEDLKASR